MEAEFLISALSLFAGVSLIPAGFIVLRDRKIQIDRQHTMQGATVFAMAFVLLCLGAMFLLNAVAQDLGLLIGLILLLVMLPFGLITIDKRRSKA